MKISLIAAIGEDGVIGRDGDLPWRLSSDLKHFKRRTRGHPVLMGRKTWESLPKRPLKGRLNIVLTRDAAYLADGATVVTSLEAGISAARESGAQEAFVIGGASVYRSSLPMADELVVTHVAVSLDGDAYFPDVAWGAWREVSSESFEATERDEYPFRVVVYERVRASADA